jgi:hypothetical protein
MGGFHNEPAHLTHTLYGFPHPCTTTISNSFQKNGWVGRREGLFSNAGRRFFFTGRRIFFLSLLKYHPNPPIYPILLLCLCIV